METKTATPPAPEAAASGASENTSKIPPTLCPNCDTALHGRFCHSCGQEQRDRIRPLGTLVREGIGTFFSLDFRIVATLRHLFFTPGRLTEAYLHGQRARFTKPFRLYLLASAVYFVVQAFAPQAGVFFGVLNVETTDSAELRKWLPRLMFALVPVFALLLKGLYVRHRQLYVEHLIFSLHYFSLYFALNTLLIPLQQLVAAASGIPWLASALGMLSVALALLAPIMYLIFAVRRVYKQSLMWSVAKGAALYAAYLVVFGIFLAALFTTGVAG